VKWLEGKTSKSSPPSRDYDSRNPRSSDWPSGRDGAARPPGSLSDTAGDHSQESLSSGLPGDRSTGIVVMLNNDPAASESPSPVNAADKRCSLDDWRRVCCTEETNLSQVQIPVCVACVVK